MKKLMIIFFLALLVFVHHPLYSGTILRVPVGPQLEYGDAVEAINQDTHSTFRGARLSKPLSTRGDLKPENTKAQLPLEMVIVRSQAEGPQNVTGPSSGTGRWSGTAPR